MGNDETPNAVDTLAGTLPLPGNGTAESGQSRLDAQAALSGANSSRSDLGFTSVDPSYITDIEHWGRRDVTHQAIYDSAQSMVPGTMHTQASVWIDIATQLSAGLFGMNLALQRELSDGFKGQFAGAAADAAQKFIQQATAVEQVISGVGARIHAAAYGAEAVKLTVPKPGSTPSNGSAPAPGLDEMLLPNAGSPSAAVDDGRHAEELYQQAIAAMNMNYNPTYRPAGENVPTFVPVDAPGEGGNPDGPNGPTNSGWNNGPTDNGGSTGTDPGGTEPGIEESPGTDDSGEADDTKPAGTSETSPASNQPGNQSPSSPNSTTPAGSSTRPSGLDSTSPAGVGGGGPGFGGGYSGGPGGSGRSVSGGPGRSVPGAPGLGTPAAAVAAGGSRPGQPGMGGMPGMGGLGGARRSEDSEKEHTTPDYLIRDREDELIGYIDPQVPGAIGENIPAAQFRRDEGEGRRR